MLKTVYTALLSACLLCFWIKGAADDFCQKGFPQITSNNFDMTEFSHDTNYLIDKPITITNSTNEDLTLQPTDYIVMTPTGKNSGYVIPATQSRSFLYYYKVADLLDVYHYCSEENLSGSIYLQFPTIHLRLKGKTESCTITGQNGIAYKQNIPDSTTNWVDVNYRPEESKGVYVSRLAENYAQSQFTHFMGPALAITKNQYIFHDNLAATTSPHVADESLSLNVVQCNDIKTNAIKITNNTNDTLSHFTAKDKSFISTSSKLFNDDSEKISAMGSTDSASTSTNYPTVIPYDALDENGKWSFSYKDDNNNDHNITVGVKSDLDPIIAGTYISSLTFRPPLYYRLDPFYQTLDSGYPAATTRGYKGLLSIIGNHNVAAILNTSTDNDSERFILDNGTVVDYDEIHHSARANILSTPIRNLIAQHKIVAAANDSETNYYFLDNNTFITANTNDDNPKLQSYAEWPGLSNAVGTNKIVTAFYAAAKKRFYIFLNNGRYIGASSTGVEYTADDFKRGNWPGIDLTYLMDQKDYSYKFYANKYHIYAMVFKNANPYLSKKKNNTKYQLHTNKELQADIPPDLTLYYVFYKSGRYVVLSKDDNHNFARRPEYPQPTSELFPSIPKDQIKNINSVVFDGNSGNLNVFLNNGTVYPEISPNINYSPNPMSDDQFFQFSDKYHSSKYIGKPIQVVTHMPSFPNHSGIFFIGDDQKAYLSVFWDHVPDMEDWTPQDYLSTNQTIISGPNGFSLVVPETGKTMGSEEEADYLLHCIDDKYITESCMGTHKLSDLLPGIYLFNPTITCKDSAAKNPDACTANVTSSPSGTTFGITINSTSNQTKH